MKIKLLFLVLLLSISLGFSQSTAIWQKQVTVQTNSVKQGKQHLQTSQVYGLNLEALRGLLTNAPVRGENSRLSNVIVSFPNTDGLFEQYRVIETPILHPDLASQYPEIKSYAGQSIENPTTVIRFSVSPNGLQSMRLSAGSPAIFIEPYTYDLSQYVVFNRTNVRSNLDPFECEVTNAINTQVNTGEMAFRNADDAVLRTYRLAVSATGEYTSYHGGTVAQALSAINATMTRVNGIFETDFNVTMTLIPNTTDVIYTNSSTDPYGSTTSNYNSQLQSTLTNVIGEANYDIGHLFANLQNNGNAGCIGCVCVDGQKGSGWTSASVPEGDFFDVDYVAHEMGHQFGANHTWTHGGNEGTNVQVEPGSGSTIMSYAGITGATDVQANVHPNFHAVSIEQVTDYVKSTSCQTNTNTGNAVPSVNAGLNYTIPRGTAFVLDGTATDADTSDVLTYCWEQMDENNASTTYPSTTATTGVAFRAYPPTTDTHRYFPNIETIKTGATSWQWEAVPDVARTLNFRLTVRDNVLGGGNNSSDDTVITVNGTAGPFVLNSPNTNVTWNAGTTQTVTWDVAGTTGNGVNASNVDIFLSTDGGDSYSIALASNVVNDGSHDIVVPNNQGTANRIMVKGTDHIFFDISNADFEIAGQVVCNATVPTGLAASSIGSDTATLSWDAVPGASFDVQYREVGASTWIDVAVNGISTSLSGLTPITQYEAQVRSRCPDTSTSAYSNIINFTTTDIQLNYCSSASTNINDEYIGRVQLNTIDNVSGGQFYSDFTNISTNLTKDTQYTITVTPTWTGTVYNEGYAVWIDYNRDGDFSDAGEQVWTQAATQTTPVSGSFTVPTSAVESSTTMRVSMKYNGVPTECETFQYGEVEDYTVLIEGSGPDTEAPVITLNGSSTINLNVGDNYTEQGATASDNVDGDLTSSIVIGGDVVNTSLAGTYLVTYNVSDAAGNAAIQVTRTVIVAPDTEAPVITLIGSSVVDITVGNTYTEQGATATDNVDGDLTSSIVIGGDIVDTNTLGAYIVTYNVSDASGNAAIEVIRTVNVNEVSIEPVTLHEGYFETGWDGWSDGGGDCSRYTGLYSYEGQYSIQLRDNSGTASAMTSPTFDLSPYADVEISFHYYARSMEIGEDFWLRYYNGSTWTTIDTYVRGTDFNNDSFNYASFTLNEAQFNLASNAQFRIQCDASGNNDYIYIDQVIITGLPSGPDITAPSAPSNLVTSNTTYNSTDLSWTASTDNIGVIGYDVYQDGVFITNVSATNYQVNGLTASTSYSFYVIARDAAGNSSTASNTVNITTLDPPDTQAPSAPANLIASNTTYNSTDLSWDASTDNIGVTGYDVYQDGAFIANVSGTTYQVTGLSSDTTYAFYVVARDLAGNSSSASNSVNITTDVYVDTIAPSQPTGLSASNTTDTSTDLSWTASTDNVGVTGYDVYQDGAFIANISGTAYQVTGLSETTTYVFYVIARDAAGNSSSTSNTINVTTLATPTCNDGIQNGDETGIDCGGSSCPACPVSDDILHEGYFETGWDGWIDGGGDAERYLGTRSYEGSYSIQIRDNSGVASSMTLSNIDVSPYSQVVVDFYFYAYSMEVGEDFWLQYFNGSAYTTIATWASGTDFNNNTFYNATVTLTAAQYAFVSNAGFRFICDAGNNIDQIYIDQVIITGTKSSKGESNSLIAVGTMLEDAENIKLYPNPVKGDILNVEIPTMEFFKYRIMNITGQIVKDGISDGTINVSTIKSGMYFIEIQDEDETIVRRFVKD